MAILATILYPALVAVVLVFTIGKLLTWMVSTERGRIAFIAIVGFVVFVAASGVLG